MMLEWFIIAMVYFPNTDRVEIKKMARPFATEQVCKEFIKTNPGIQNDMILLEPNSIGASFKCFDSNGIKQFQAKRRSI